MCGFFSASSIQKYLDADGPDDFDSEGTGMLPKGERASKTADCVVTSRQTGTARLSAVIVEYGDQHSRSSVQRQIDAETAKDKRCTPQQWEGFGKGNICVLDVSTRVAVATDQRLIRIDLVVEGGQPPASEETALDFARQANVAANDFDETK